MRFRIDCLWAFLCTVSGAWVPDTQMAIALLESVLLSMKTNNATIIDKRRT